MADNKTKVRLAGPDIVRSFAAFSVVAIHFFLNSGYYSQPLQGTGMFIMTYVRWFFLICVPLFMILTGFFKNKKTISKSHYMSLIPILVAYFVLTMAKVLVAHRVYGVTYAEMNIVRQLFNYNFAWYVGMYVCMILLIPFFNILWNNISTKRDKHILLISLAFVCSMYPLVLYIAPSYWQMLYPLFYYYLGAYISEYRPHPKKIIVLLVALLSTLINATISFRAVDGSNFDWTVLGPVDCGYSTITVVITAVCVFLLFYDIDVKSTILKTVFRKISEVSFEIYLMAAVYDIIIYAYLGSRVYNYSEYYKLAFIIVPCDFILSWVTSMVYKLAYDLCKKGIVAVYTKKGNSKSEN